MRRIVRAKLLAGALAVGVVPYVATSLPAMAQDYGDVSLNSFHDVLSQYGYWGYSDRWGLVWQPADVGYDFRPYYTGGHWVYTDDYGWYWDAAQPWGDIAFHYGRWVNDPDSGWLWIPGYTWSPGWVTWRSNGQYIGWMPAPPDRAFLQGNGDVSFGLSFGRGGVSFGFDNDPYYGYRSWYGPGFDDRSFANNWVFVGVGDVADRDYRSVIVRDPGRVMKIIHQTRDVTHYTVVNNFVVNKSIDVRVVQRAAGHPIDVVSSRSVIRQPNLVMRADAGQRIQMHERMIAPRGNGLANSAPPPPAAVVSKLSANVPQRNGGGSPHLYSKSTISNPETQSHFHAAPGGRGVMPDNGHNGMSGPGGPATGDDRRRGPQEGNPGAMNGPGNPDGRGDNFQPNDENRHRDQGSSPGGMTGPGSPNAPGNYPPPGGETRHRDEGPQGNAPNGTGSSTGPGEMSGPRGMSGPANPPPSTETHHRAPANPTPDGMNGPGSMNGPGRESSPPDDMGRRTQAPPSGSTMSVPKPAPAAGEGTPPPEKKKHKPDQPPPG